MMERPTVAAVYSWKELTTQIILKINIYLHAWTVYMSGGTFNFTHACGSQDGVYLSNDGLFSVLWTTKGTLYYIMDYLLQRLDSDLYRYGGRY
jgi:hypothetical protein